jgi:hypothetical protein
METTTIQQELYSYIDNSDEKLLKLMLALAKDYTGDDDFEYDFTAEDIEVLDRNREKRLNGESKTYTWEEAKNIITSGRPGNSPTTF